MFIYLHSEIVTAVVSVFRIFLLSLWVRGRGFCAKKELCLHYDRSSWDEGVSLSVKGKRNLDSFYCHELKATKNHLDLLCSILVPVVISERFVSHPILALLGVFLSLFSVVSIYCTPSLKSWLTVARFVVIFVARFLPKRMSISCFLIFVQGAVLFRGRCL